jgi:V-type H+-transporting ATPase subunit E
MQQKEADRQIEQMIAFIYQEAKEKAEEIRVKTESEFMAEKLSLQTEASIQIREEFERKRKERVVAKRIEKSKMMNNARYTTMRHRDDKMKQLKAAVTARLSEVAKNPKYKELLRFLLVQGIMTMQEENIIVQCRKEDENLVKPILGEAVEYYHSIVEKATGLKPPVSLSMSKDYLPAGPAAGKQGASCCGGLVLSAKGGKIVCRNTLDSRLEHAFYDLEPQIRGLLFGVRPKPQVKAAPAGGHGH